MVSSNKLGKTHVTTCILNAGDHSFIDRPSRVVYRIAETAYAAYISAMVERHYYHRREAVTVDIYNKFAEELCGSDDVRPRIDKFARDNGIDSYTF